MIIGYLKKSLKGDPYIWTIIFFLCLSSILVVTSSIEALAYKTKDGNSLAISGKHIVLVFVSWVTMWQVHKMNYKTFANLSYLMLIVSAVLILVALLIGPSINSSKRWISIPGLGLTVQPSDFAKIALVVYISRILSLNQDDPGSFHNVIKPIGAWTLVICGLIGLSNVSTAAMLFGTCLLLLFVGRVPGKYFGYMMIVGIVAIGIFVSIGTRSATVKSRINKFLFAKELPYQAEQGFIAIANGHIFGKGPGNSNQKGLLPHPYSDYIYAMVIEEYGFIGGFFVLFLYLSLLYRGLIAVSRSNNAFGGLLSAGLSFGIALQAMFNMAVAVGLVPVTGQPLPMLSMGGTSLIFTGVSLGMILSVSRGEEVNSNSPSQKIKQEGPNVFRKQTA